MSTSDMNTIVAGYETMWYFADFWPGEYPPPRFTVLREGVVLAARSEMKLAAPQDIRCPLPKFATYSPWNYTRNAADNLLYRTVTKVSPVTVTDAITMQATTQLDQIEVTLNLQPGDTLEFLIYHGEGFALHRYQGTNYVLDESELEGKVQYEENARGNDMWLELPAETGGRGWVLFRDAIANEGVIETDYGEFGTAHDLPDSESLSLEEVEFVSGGADLTDTAKQALDNVAVMLLRVIGMVFEVGGHTDSIGSSEANQKLSYLRAVAVADYLVDQAGIAHEMLRVKGYGEAEPIADNGTTEGRAVNRRVELKLLEL